MSRGTILSCGVILSVGDKVSLDARVSRCAEESATETAAEVSSILLSVKESLRPAMLSALPASIPNDWNAASATSKVGNHIFAQKFFIRICKDTDKIGYILLFDAYAAFFHLLKGLSVTIFVYICKTFGQKVNLESGLLQVLCSVAHAILCSNTAYIDISSVK